MLLLALAGKLLRWLPEEWPQGGGVPIKEDKFLDQVTRAHSTGEHCQRLWGVYWALGNRATI